MKLDHIIPAECLIEAALTAVYEDSAHLFVEHADFDEQVADAASLGKCHI